MNGKGGRRCTCRRPGSIGSTKWPPVAHSTLGAGKRHVSAFGAAIQFRVGQRARIRARLHRVQLTSVAIAGNSVPVQTWQLSQRL